jgi:hypothetical protein
MLVPLAMIGCATPGANAPEGVSAQVAIAAAPAPYQLQIVVSPPAVRRWVAADVISFTATMYQLQGSTYQVFGTAKEVTASAPQATFTGLATGQAYKLGVVAHGNEGAVATHAISDLNAATPSETPIDLTASTQTTGTIAVPVTVLLDPVDADPSLPITVGAPTDDGTYLAPTASETVTVQ